MSEKIMGTVVPNDKDAWLAYLDAPDKLTYVKWVPHSNRKAAR